MGETEIAVKSGKRRGKKTIGFDPETVTKSTAEKLINEQNSKQVTEVTNDGETHKKKRRRNKKGKQTSETTENQEDNNVVADNTKTKKKKNKTPSDVDLNPQEETNGAQDKPKKRKRKMEKSDTLETETQDELDPKKPVIKGEESIRAKKRRKFAELQKQKKQTHELDMQQKCLNYLSLWKHNRSEWKFEKLKQIWLQTNLYDDTRIPKEFWHTVVDYFNSSKGKVHQMVLKEALKILDKEEESMEVDETGDDVDKDKGEGEEEVAESASKVKYNRARSIVQSLQE